MAKPKWHLEHANGREWTDDELAEFVRVEREHERMWPYDAGNWATTALDRYGRIYVHDACETWHQLVDDVVVIWDD